MYEAAGAHADHQHGQPEAVEAEWEPAPGLERTGCIRPEWGKCVSFPNGGSHTGMSIQKEKIQAEVTPGPDICVINEEEISKLIEGAL